MYDVIIERSVIKQLQKISQPDYRKIKAALSDLAFEPRPHGYLKLKGRDGYRIHVGNYRIIYEIVDEKLIVLVLTIAHRKDVYE
jgi:mRNA interferase RelE/StbE